MALSVARAHISVDLRSRGEYLSVDLSFVNCRFVNFKQKILFERTNVFESTKSPHFPLRGKVDQLIKRKRVFFWSTYMYY